MVPLSPQQPRDSFDELDIGRLVERQSEKWQRHPADVLPSFIAEMDFPVARPIVEAIGGHLARGGDFGYAFSYTEQTAVHRTLAEWAHKNYSWMVPPEQIVLFPDVMRAVEVTLIQLTSPRDAVVIDVPAYPAYFDAVPGLGRHLIRNPMILRNGVWHADMAGLERAFRAGASAYILCNPHNPTGKVFTAQELQRILALAAAYRVLVISDEVHAPLVYRPHRHIPVASLPQANGVRIVTAISATKGWNIAGLKCGFAISNSSHVHEHLMSMPPRARDGVGILGITASIAAFANSHEWLQKTLNYLDGNRRYVSALLRCFGGKIGYVPPQGTYLAWLDCRKLAENIHGADICGLFLERGRVALSNGDEFGAPGFLRMNLATSRDILVEKIHRMALATGFDCELIDCQERIELAGRD
ncbi:aminotransferase class I/II-fold pyridoxal phosphate-dependent enzyme [Embleya sp. NBC_00888]|uniref:MalY/PatB family protein n=1 Tax=Embleya sp. NBC_00888 TaxID=2975960 RepID=UPI0038639598|nr:aminotransferase class I/II-fold pyridoxal phosphate-dependent enzyme [Embleya sp. NBC_00888]